MREWSNEHLFSSASFLGVIFGGMAACIVDGWATYMHRDRAFARTTKVNPLQTTSPFTELTKESNSSPPLSFFFKLSFNLSEKEKAYTFKLPGSTGVKKGVADRSLAMASRCT